MYKRQLSGGLVMTLKTMAKIEMSFSGESVSYTHLLHFSATTLWSVRLADSGDDLKTELFLIFNQASKCRHGELRSTEINDFEHIV